MPEGPEVWILSKAINSYYLNTNTLSIGKHLIIKDIKENWSFGLNGYVNINASNQLIKMNGGQINGEIIKFNNYTESTDKLGIDWMTSSKEALVNEIYKWNNSKQKLGRLLLDQSKICGIGVAWGSEILFNARLNPNLKACEQSLSYLAKSMIEIRKQVQGWYECVLTNILCECALQLNSIILKDFIEKWFENLYKIRKMNVYKKGTKIQILGRSWWI